MKKIFILFALAAVALASCTDDNNSAGGNKFPPAQVGDEIIIGGTMSFDESDRNKAKTRTVYGDKKTGEGGYTEIKWLQNDQIRIYCEQATAPIEGQYYCDYVVASGYIDAASGKYEDEVYETEHAAYFESSEESGLKWGGAVDTQHLFYGVYPAPGMLENSGHESDKDVANAISIDKNGVKAHLPNVQYVTRFVAPETIEGTDGTDNKHYIIHPSMRYAYMVAQGSGVPSDGAVDLTFYPIVTAVEMTLENNGTASINEISLISLSSAEGKIICGDFTSGYGQNPTVTVTSTEDTYKTVSVPVAAVDENDKTVNVTLNPGDKLTFTAFMILNADDDLSNITVTLLYNNGAGRKSATLTGNGDVNIVQAQKKNFIHGVKMNFSQSASVGLDSWISGIPNEEKGNDVLLKRFSIPVAGGAASGHSSLWTSDAATAEIFLEQKLEIEDLWNQGIRGFEFTVDHASESSTDLGNCNIYCNSKDCGITLNAAVTFIQKQLIDHPAEFAMVIVTYQDKDGWSIRDDDGDVNYNRNPSAFMSELEEFWEKVRIGTNSSDITGWGVKQKPPLGDGTTQEVIPGTKKYSSTLSLEDARGKLFCIARPTSEYEDNYTTISHRWGNINEIATAGTAINSYGTPHDDILVIEGWGALKDKFEKRGYTTCQFHRGSGNDALTDSDNDDIVLKVGYDADKVGRPFDVAGNDATTTLVSGEKDSDNTIIKNHMDYVNRNLDSLITNFSYNTSEAGTAAWVQEWARVSNLTDAVSINNKNICWPNSTQEKINNVIECLTKAVGRGEDDDTIYINSLCGYFIDEDVPESLLPNPLVELNGGYTISLGSIQSGYKYSPLSASSSYGAMSGNIGDHAKWINDYFYNYIISHGAEYSGKPVGIIMMDRVSNDATADPAGYYIPLFILSNNPYHEDEPANVLSISVSDEDIDVTGEGVELAAPAKR